MDTAAKLAIIVAIVGAIRNRIPAIDKELAMVVACIVGVGVAFVSGAPGTWRDLLAVGISLGLTAAGGMQIIKYGAGKVGLDASAVSAKAISSAATTIKTGGSVLALVLGLGAIGATQSGCAAFQTAHKWAETAQGFTTEAQAKVGELEAEIRAALAVLPDVPPEAKAEIEKAIAAVDKALAAAVTASGATADLTDESSLVTIFGGFVKAWDLLSAAAEPYLLKAKSTGKISASAAPAERIEPSIVALAHRKAAR